MKEDILYAVAVCRVSTSKQDLLGSSLEDQLNQIEITCKRLEIQYLAKIKIEETFELSESASVEFEDQPLQKVLAYCKESKKPIRFVFIKCLDRFTRAGATIYSRLKIEFSKLGIILVDTLGIVSSIEVNTLEYLGVKYDWSVFSPTYITELLESERAKSEVRDIQTRMIGAAIRYTRMGYFCGGATELGYQAIKKDTEQGKRFLRYPHPEEALWFRKIFELRAQGTLSDEQIADEVNKMGFKTRPMNIRDKENKNRIIKHRGEKRLNVKMLRKYIANPIYCGVDMQKWLEKPTYFKGESVVSVELFNKANKGKIVITDQNGSPQVLKGKTPLFLQRKLKLNPLYPFKSFILCPICKHPLKASSPRGKSSVVPTYHCSLGHKYWGKNAKKLEKTIYEFLDRVKFSQKFKDNFEANFLKNWNKRMDQLNEDNLFWEKRIVELRENRKMLKDKLKLATTPVGFQTIEEEIENADSQIEDATLKRNKVEDGEVDVQVLINSAKYWMEHYKELVLNTPNRLTRGTLFGLIFEEKPDYEKLKNGTPQLSQLFALNEEHKHSKSSLGRAGGNRTPDERFGDARYTTYLQP